MYWGTGRDGTGRDGTAMARVRVGVDARHCKGGWLEWGTMGGRLVVLLFCHQKAEEDGGLVAVLLTDYKYFIRHLFSVLDAGVVTTERAER